MTGSEQDPPGGGFRSVEDEETVAIIGEIELPEPEPPEPPVDNRNVPWKRLHPASLVVNLIPRTWRFLVSFWPLILAFAVGRPRGPSGGPEAQYFDFFYLLLLFGSGAASTLVHYLTLRYRVRKGKLEIKQGLLNREARIISPARIQNVERVVNVFHKLAGLAEVRLETAGDIRTEGLLSALSVADADALMKELDALRGHSHDKAEAAQAAPVLKLGFLELVAHGLSSRRAGLASLLFFGVMEVAAIVDPEGSQDLAQTLNSQRLLALALIAIAVSWVLSALMSLLRHFRFVLYREPATAAPTRLRSEWGLLTRRRVEIPLAKVQVARVEEPLVRRWMGFGSLSVETAALGPVTGEGPPAPELEIPLVERERMGELISLPFPGAEVDPWSLTLTRPHRQALFRALNAAALRWAPLILLAGLLGGWTWAALPGALLLGALSGASLDWLYQGWLVTDRMIVARRGFWRRRTWVVPQEKLQSVHLVQGPLMRLHGLGRLVLRVAGSQVTLPDLAFDPAAALLEQLTPSPRAKP